MTLVQLRSSVPPDRIEAMIGRRASWKDFDLSLDGGDASIYKPNGHRLITVVRGGVSKVAADAAYGFLHGLRNVTTANRGAYSASERIFKVKRDGTQSSTGTTPPVRSATVGFYDRYPRYPFCRCLPAAARDPEGWELAQPFIREVADLFAKKVPDRYAAQLGIAKKTEPDYVIPGTPFTTLTVNNTFAGGYHRDAGDFAPGFGVMVVLRKGEYGGCDLVIPAYRTSVDLRHRDVVFFDVHEVHGNMPFHSMEGPEGLPEEGGYERISVVMYFRQGMTECLPPDQELARVKALRGNLEAPPGYEEPEDDEP